MRLRITTWLLLAVCIFVLAPAATLYADTITLKSGNAPVGQRDTLITVRGVSITLVPGDDPVLAANISPQNALVVATPSYWFTPPSGCQWVTPNSTAGGGYVYEMTFQLPTVFYSPRMTMGIGNDDWAAMFLNGHKLTDWNESGFGGLYTFTFDDPSRFAPGANLLQFFVGNGVGTPTGMLLNGSVEYQTVPEPSSIATILLGITGIASGIVRRKRA